MLSGRCFSISAAVFKGFITHFKDGTQTRPDPLASLRVDVKHAGEPWIQRFAARGISRRWRPLQAVARIAASLRGPFHQEVSPSECSAQLPFLPPSTSAIDSSPRRRCAFNIYASRGHSLVVPPEAFIGNSWPASPACDQTGASRLWPRPPRSISGRALLPLLLGSTQ